MRIDVLKSLQLRMVRSVAAVGLVGVVAGCSSDVARFDDGFYTGAVPQGSTRTAAASQPYPGDAGQATTTGGNGASGLGMPTYESNPAAARQPRAGQASGQLGAYGSSPGYTSSSGSASAASVQRNALPPPTSPTHKAPAPGLKAPAATSTTSATRGAPPSTLGEQASRIAKPAPKKAESGPKVTVQNGDTLLSIARRTGVSVSDIKRANGLDGSTIRIGQTLMVPGGKAGATEVASVEAETSASAEPAPKPQTASAEPKPYTPPASAEKTGRPSVKVASKQSRPTVAVSEEAEAKVAAVAPDATGISQFRWPVQGRVVARFGEKVGSRRNDGLNISVPRGTPVKAAENGVVIYAGDGLKEFGNTVLVKHDGGLVTVYGHADSISVERGAKVRRGQEVAKSGMSGDTDIPILHFEVRKDSAPVNPANYLQ